MTTFAVHHHDAAASPHDAIHPISPPPISSMKKPNPTNEMPFLPSKTLDLLGFLRIGEGFRAVGVSSLLVVVASGYGRFMMVPEESACKEGVVGGDKDGQATIVAVRDIQRGEEVTISYIDEELSYEERQRSLADYGFRCKCSKCSAEEES
ncbi:hypothetical protein KSS87_012399 [Heliosperma pusillum]|nr:hypothetical protein KSS87_012399 [Heliosperma pusillum]